MASLAPLISSENQCWNTPANVLDLVRQVGHIRMDPSTDATNPVGADYFCTPETDGLAQKWCRSGLTFCNPPYGRELKAWATKARAESEMGAEIIFLVPARPDTAWWHNNIVPDGLVCFWRGRLKFVGAPASAPFPSAIVYWGPNKRKFREVFGPKGWIP